MCGPISNDSQILELVREQRLRYLENANVDTVFLLKKKELSS